MCVYIYIYIKGTHQQPNNTCSMEAGNENKTAKSYKPESET